MKIVLFNVKYSPNLGDGVIAECLEAALRAETGAEVLSLDLAGRTAYGCSRYPARGAAIRLLRHLPPQIRRSLVRARLARSLERRTEHWARVLEGADLAVIGGGNLFQDADLNFPLKIAAALDAARAAGVPVAVHAAGVAPGWSEEALALFGRIRGNDLRHVALRDIASAAAWRGLLGDAGPPPLVCRDPGLLAADLARPRKAGQPGTAGKGRIGLGITHPAILGYHATGAVAGVGTRDGGAFYRDLALDLIRRGERVTLFNNGATEDDAFQDALLEDPALAIAVATGDLAAAAPPQDPSDLVTLISGFRGIVAHRLHAGIVAYGLGIPHVGLAWDMKVESFFRSVGRAGYLVARGADAPVDIAALVLRACSEGIDPVRRRQVVEETRADIAGLSQVVRQVARPLAEVAA